MSLTTQDIENIRKLFQLEVEPLKEKINLLPTMDEFLTRTDETMAELKEIRQEITILGNRTYDDEERISALEKIHPEGQHTAQ